MAVRFRLPSSSMTVSWLALAIALGGTAFAATATLVRITDNSGTRIAGVDGRGRLKAASAPAAAPVPFSAFTYTAKAMSWFVGPTKATAVATSIAITNEYDQANGAKVRVALYLLETSNGNCGTYNRLTVLGVFNVAAGDTTQVVAGPGIVLKPTVAGNDWCLATAMSVQGSPSSYYLAPTTVLGFVEAGDIGVAAIPTASEASASPRQGR